MGGFILPRPHFVRNEEKIFKKIEIETYIDLKPYMMLQIFMKFFLPFLVFAFILSSFSAVAEAYCTGDCAHTEASSQSSNTAHCADHQKSSDSEKGSNGKTSKSVCMDCHHCCSAHGAGLQSFDKYALGVSASLVPLSPDAIDVSGYLFSLLRPPKSLV